MGKTIRIFLTALALVFVLCFSGCKGGKEAYKGDYHYSTEYGIYGVKVSVEVKNGIIKEMDVIKSNYRDVSVVEEEDKDFLADKQVWIESFKGKSVEEVLSYTVAIEANGEPKYVSANGFFLSGIPATAGSLILAVQNALSKI